MFQQIGATVRKLPGRIGDRIGQRATALFLALLIEGLLALLLLTLSPSILPREEADVAVFGFNPEPVAPPAPEADPASEPVETESEQAPQEPVEEPVEETAEEPEPPQPDPPEASPSPPVEPLPSPAPPPFIQLPRDQMARADIAAAPARPAPRAGPKRPMVGPPAPSRAADTPRVDGEGPNGEPLYAASWYREPYEDELRGYLSTARGPGWGLIACRTVAGFRVEDCVAVGESPQGSGIARAVLGAAWQFRVRPPRVGGRTRVGEWVRIRIDYGMDGG